MAMSHGDDGLLMFVMITLLSRWTIQKQVHSPWFLEVGNSKTTILENSVSSVDFA